MIVINAQEPKIWSWSWQSGISVPLSLSDKYWMFSMTCVLGEKLMFDLAKWIMRYVWWVRIISYCIYKISLLCFHEISNVWTVSLYKSSFYINWNVVCCLSEHCKIIQINNSYFWDFRGGFQLCTHQGGLTGSVPFIGKRPFPESSQDRCGKFSVKDMKFSAFSLQLSNDQTLNKYVMEITLRQKREVNYITNPVAFAEIHWWIN